MFKMIIFEKGSTLEIRSIFYVENESDLEALFMEYLSAYDLSEDNYSYGIEYMPHY